MSFGSSKPPRSRSGSTAAGPSTRFSASKHAFTLILMSFFVSADLLGREVDVHAITFDDRGYGLFQLSDGRQWPFPPSAFRGQGRIAGREVRCLSAEAQVQCHAQGVRPRGEGPPRHGTPSGAIRGRSSVPSMPAGALNAQQGATHELGPGYGILESVARWMRRSYALLRPVVVFVLLDLFQPPGVPAALERGGEPGRIA